MDEIHKLPLHCLLYFTQLAKLFAEQNNCTWIFGSATPLPDSDKIFRDIQISKLNDKVSSSFKQSPLLYERRIYKKIEDQNAESGAELIRHCASGDGQNLMLLSLVERGTFAVAKILGIPTDPWNRIFTGLNPKHPIVWLDGSVPPLLREHYLSFVKSRLNSGLPATLLTTQIVEVGVDLDFDAGYTDLISLASILQRGGRVARESRSDGRPRSLHLFNFKTIVVEHGAEVEKTTKEILDAVTLGSVMLTERAAEKIRMLLTNNQYRLKTYFSSWQYHEIKKEIELIEANAQIATEELQSIKDPSISDIVTLDLQHAHVGLTLQHLETIAQLYSEEPHGESVVLFESSEEVQVVQDLFGANQEKRGYQELANRRVIIHPNLVASLLSEGFIEIDIQWWTDRTIAKPGDIVY
jgi:hypothetical protein